MINIFQSFYTLLLTSRIYYQQGHYSIFYSFYFPSHCYYIYFHFFHIYQLYIVYPHFDIFYSDNCFNMTLFYLVNLFYLVTLFYSDIFCHYHNFYQMISPMNFFQVFFTTIKSCNFFDLDFFEVYYHFIRFLICFQVVFDHNHFSQKIFIYIINFFVPQVCFFQSSLIFDINHIRIYALNLIHFYFLNHQINFPISFTFFPSYSFFGFSIPYLFNFIHPISSQSGLIDESFKTQEFNFHLVLNLIKLQQHCLLVYIHKTISQTLYLIKHLIFHPLHSYKEEGLKQRYSFISQVLQTVSNYFCEDIFHILSIKQLNNQPSRTLMRQLSAYLLQFIRQIGNYLLLNRTGLLQKCLQLMARQSIKQITWCWLNIVCIQNALYIISVNVCSGKIFKQSPKCYRVQLIHQNQSILKSQSTMNKIKKKYQSNIILVMMINLIIYLCIKSSLNIISKLHIRKIQKMISRNASGPLTPKVNIDNLCVSLSQKDKIIFILQKQLQGFRNLRENYQRLKDRKTQLLDKCETMSRQISINRGNQDVRVDNSQKYVIQLKMLVSSLESQLQNKQYQLKDLKFQAETLIKSSELRQNDLLESGNSIQSIKSSMEVLKMESGRLHNQISQTKEQIQRIKNYQIETESARQKIKNQVHNTQTFIRQLGYQELRLNQDLSNLEDQNNSIDQIISELGRAYDEKKSKAREVRELKESIILKIKTKELEKGRIQTQFVQKQKQLKGEKQKEKSLNEVTLLKKTQIQRLSNMLKEVNEQSEDFCKNNMDLETINLQLQRDLSLSQKHYQSIVKNNQNIKSHIQNYYKTNVLAIKKLRKPMDEGWVELGKKDFENLETTTDGFMKKGNSQSK